MDTENITEKAYSGVMAIWHKMITFLPDLIVATIFLLVGWLVASMVKRFLNKFLIKIGFNTFLEKLGLDTLFKKMEVSVTGSQVVASKIGRAHV